MVRTAIEETSMSWMFWEASPLQSDAASCMKWSLINHSSLEPFIIPNQLGIGAKLPGWFDAETDEDGRLRGEGAGDDELICSRQNILNIDNLETGCWWASYPWNRKHIQDQLSFEVNIISSTIAWIFSKISNPASLFPLTFEHVTLYIQKHVDH